MMAVRMFEAGPAREIRAASRRGLSRLYGSNWTGFAQPMGMTGAPSARITTVTNKTVVPTRS